MKLMWCYCSSFGWQGIRCRCSSWHWLTVSHRSPHETSMELNHGWHRVADYAGNGLSLPTWYSDHRLGQMQHYNNARRFRLGSPFAPLHCVRITCAHLGRVCMASNSVGLASDPPPSSQGSGSSPVSYEAHPIGVFM